MLIIGARLQGFTAPGSMGVVNGARFVNCFWPKLDQPTRIFADGSSNIEVMGNTPRNVWFPDDVVFLPYHPDALYPAERAVLNAFPFNRMALINLGPAEAQIWADAYTDAVNKLPSTATVIETPRHVNFLRHREEKSRRTKTLVEDSVTVNADGSLTILKAGTQIEKIDYHEFVAQLTTEECIALIDGKIAEKQLRDSKEFIHISDVNYINGEKVPVTLSQFKAAK